MKIHCKLTYIMQTNHLRYVVICTVALCELFWVTKETHPMLCEACEHLLENVRVGIVAGMDAHKHISTYV